MWIKSVVFLVLIPFFVYGGETDHLLFYQNKPRYKVNGDVRPTLVIENKVVKEGDRLVLETGEIIHFVRVLGSGTNAIVILDSQARAVRLIQFIHSIKVELDFQETYQFLKRYLPSKHLVQMIPNPFKSIYVRLVESLEIEIHLNAFLAKNPSLNDSKLLELFDFLEHFRNIPTFWDFYPFQIGYVNGRGWVIFDFGALSAIDLNYEKVASNHIDEEWTIFMDNELYNYIIQELNRRDRQYYSYASKSAQCFTFLNERY